MLCLKTELNQFQSVENVYLVGSYAILKKIKNSKNPTNLTFIFTALVRFLILDILESFHAMTMNRDFSEWKFCKEFKNNHNKAFNGTQTITRSETTIRLLPVTKGSIFETL